MSNYQEIEKLLKRKTEEIDSYLARERKIINECIRGFNGELIGHPVFIEDGMNHIKFEKLC